MSADDILSAFSAELDALAKLTKLNCRPLVLSLTLIAKESVHVAPQIVDLIAQKLRTLPGDQLLTLAYLWHSITQDIGGKYKDLLAVHVVDVMSQAYERAPATVKPNLLKLFEVWRTVEIYPPHLIRQLFARIGHGPPVVEQPRSSVTGLKRGRPETHGGFSPPPSPPLSADAPQPPIVSSRAPPPPPVPKLPVRMATLRRELYPLVGTGDLDPKLVPSLDELQRMYEFVLSVQGDDAIITGRSRLDRELTALRQWRASLPPAPSPLASGDAAQRRINVKSETEADPWASARAARALKPFPPGPCHDIFQLYSALAQHKLLPLLGTRGGNVSAPGTVVPMQRLVRKTFDRGAVIRRLYDALPLQCPMTGRRFPRGGERLLRSHMDTLFRRTQGYAAEAAGGIRHLDLRSPPPPPRALRSPCPW